MSEKNEKEENTKAEPLELSEATGITLRAVRLSDAEAIAQIYRPYVEHTAITFEYEAPDTTEFKRRIKAVTAKYPWIVAQDREGKLLGYMYCGAFKARAAYDWGVETSIYLDEKARGHHLGTRLEQAFCKLLKEAGYRNVNACITEPTRENDPYLTAASPKFHERLGYKVCAHFHSCGYKFGLWYDMIWMEKMIGPHDADPTHPKVLQEAEINQLLHSLMQ